MKSNKFIPKEIVLAHKAKLAACTPLVEIRAINKSFNGKQILNDVNLTIYKGEMFALLGGSGCGKSTLLRIMAGFEIADSGEIWIDGMPMNEIQPYQRPVNMMFQSYALFPHLTVRENVAFGLRRDRPKLAVNEIARRVDEALDMVQMISFANSSPNQLSGGQQQRVALARSIIKRPKLLLLDEPLAALDKKIREKTQVELNNIQIMLGITFIMVTHDQEEALAMSDRIAIMHEGRLLQVGTPRQIYEAPNSCYVADFMGSSNIFATELISKEVNSARLKIHGLDDEVTIIADRQEEIESIEATKIGENVWLAVRPENMSISHHSIAHNNYENYILGNVLDKAYLGDMVVYHIQLRNDEIIDVELSTLENKMLTTQINESDLVAISWDRDDGILLRR